MKSLFEKSTLDEIDNRISQLSSLAQRQWGKMEVDQMLTHCAETMEVTLGKKRVSRGFLGYVLGPLFKSKFYDDSASPKHSPTAKEFIIVDRRDVEVAKKRLLELVREFHTGGEAKCTKEPHAFFGKLTSEQWAKGVYKHLDHHLRQFGV